MQAIIGPQTSTQAKFVIELGNKTQVPIISFSARSPSLSSQNSYFIRTAWNDSSQAKVIASIVQAFEWREVVPIFEDSDYGSGIIPDLVDAFQEIGAHVPYRSKIPISATKDKILNELNQLKSNRTRVFVVHMTYSLGLQLFSSANEAGMMKEGYVWITTYGLTDLVDLNGLSAISVMKGVLGVKPYIRETNKLRDFRVRWRKKFYQEDPNAEVSEPTTFGLWAYDTVQSLAVAADGLNSTNYTSQESDVYNGSTDLATLGSSLTGPNLTSRIINSNIDGMSGKFHLIDGQLESSAFEIINVVRHGKRRVGFWTQAYKLSRHMDKKADLHSITWPGGGKTAPKGWEWPTSGKELRIGVPVKPGFSQFVKLEKDNKTIGKAYCTDVFDAVMKKLPYHVPYKYVPYADAKGESNGTYDDLVYQVYLEVSDNYLNLLIVLTWEKSRYSSQQSCSSMTTMDLLFLLHTEQLVCYLIDELSFHGLKFSNFFCSSSFFHSLSFFLFLINSFKNQAQPKIRVKVGLIPGLHIRDFTKTTSWQPHFPRHVDSMNFIFCLVLKLLKDKGNYNLIIKLVSS